MIFRPKSKIQTFFPPKIRWSPKKKKVFAKIQGDFSSNFASSNVWRGALFVRGGLFSIFHRKSASKAQKTCDFAYFTSQWGRLEPPPPPPGYATDLEPYTWSSNCRIHKRLCLWWHYWATNAAGSTSNPMQICFLLLSFSNRRKSGYIVNECTNILFAYILYCTRVTMCIEALTTL